MQAGRARVATGHLSDPTRKTGQWYDNGSSDDDSWDNDSWDDSDDWDDSDTDWDSDW